MKLEGDMLNSVAHFLISYYILYKMIIAIQLQCW